MSHLSLPSVPRRSTIAAVVTVGLIGVGVLGRIAFGRPKADVDVLTYTDVVDYLIKNRPELENIHSAALLRQRDKKSWIISFLFLTHEGSILTGSDGRQYGQKIRVRRLDDELMEVFANTDLIRFE